MITALTKDDLKDKIIKLKELKNSVEKIKFSPLTDTDELANSLFEVVIKDKNFKDIASVLLLMNSNNKTEYMALRSQLSSAVNEIIEEKIEIYKLLKYILEKYDELYLSSLKIDKPNSSSSSGITNLNQDIQNNQTNQNNQINQTENSNTLTTPKTDSKPSSTLNQENQKNFLTKFFDGFSKFIDTKHLVLNSIYKIVLSIAILFSVFYYAFSSNSLAAEKAVKIISDIIIKHI